jgi:hypothetical protein
LSGPRRNPGAALLAAAVALAACGPKQHDGALVIELSTDLRASEADKVELSLETEGGFQQQRVFALAELPAKVAAVPEGSPNFSATITATARAGDGSVVVTQTAQVTFGREVTTRWLFLSRDCAGGQACADPQKSCVRGRLCVDRANVGTQPPTEGPDAGAGQDAATGDGPQQPPPDAADARPRQPGPPGMWVAMATGSDIPTTAALNGLWPVQANDIWVVGAMPPMGGVAFHHDGNAWKALPPPAGTPALFGVWASGPDDAWAVGLGGTILHFTAGTWTRVQSGVVVHLTGVWGAGPANIFAVGRMGPLTMPTRPTALHWNGTDWQMVSGGLAGDLFAVAGSRDEAVAVGQMGGVFRIGAGNMGVWQKVDVGSTMNPLYGVWARNATDVWVVGERVALHYDGSRWTTVPGAPDTTFSVWASGVDDAWAVGSPAPPRSPIARYDGVTWSAVASPAATTLNNVRGISPSQVWAVGNAGTVLRFQAQ